MLDRPFTPETQPVTPETTVINLVSGCYKKESHNDHRAILDLMTDHLPERWRKEQVLNDLKMVARRIVHLRVVKPSPYRRGNNPYGHYGSGFITIDPVHGAVINTSKHVVYDPFEADHTIVTLFYDDDKYALEIFQAEKEMVKHVCGRKDLKSDFETSKTSNLQSKSIGGVFMYKGSSDKFRSVMCTDYTAFLCKELPVHKLFSEQEIKNSDVAFSWFKSSLKRWILCPQQEIDIAVISHPHGGPKIITFGKYEANIIK